MENDYIIECPKCGYTFKLDMNEPDDWECPNCQHVGTVIWSGDTIDHLIRDSYDKDEIFEDPDHNKPSSCISCDNLCYPDCVDSCSIFDD